MTIHKFKRAEADSLITVPCKIAMDRYTLASGITRSNIEVCSYDFLANQVLSEFDGVLGLDFFETEKICIDFAESEITVTKK